MLPQAHALVSTAWRTPRACSPPSCAARGIELVGVTKAVDGEPLVGQAMLAAGCAGLADSPPARPGAARRPRPGAADAHPRAAGARGRRGGAGGRPRGALRRRHRRVPSASTRRATRSSSCSRWTSATAAKACCRSAAAGGEPARRPAGHRPARHQRQLRLPLRPAPQPTLFRQAEDVLAAVAARCDRRAAALARRHVLPAAPRGLPAALPHRDPRRRRLAVRIRLRLRRRARRASSAATLCSPPPCWSRPPSRRPRPARPAWTPSATCRTSPCRPEKPGTRCSPWAGATPSPRASGRCSPAPPSPA